MILIQDLTFFSLQPLSSRNAHILEDVRTRLDEVSHPNFIISVITLYHWCMKNGQTSLAVEELYCTVVPCS